jgi:hypothetical protein
MAYRMFRDGQVGSMIFFYRKSSIIDWIFFSWKTHSDVIGDLLDIHSGGIDLCFPHHDNEMAQSEVILFSLPFVSLPTKRVGINVGRCLSHGVPSRPIMDVNNGSITFFMQVIYILKDKKCPNPSRTLLLYR